MIIASRTYTVSEITELIRMLLEAEFTGVRLEGEISNCRPASSGHLYFTLKDRDAMIQAVMFRNRCSGLSFRPSDGQKVIVEGNISVYGKRGTYQIVCESMRDDGTGDILLILEERKRRLAEEGLFDQARKRPLPMMPSRVAVVTSPTGAAIRDILNVLRRRNSGLNLVVLPAAVQGDGAAEAIARQIETANLHRLGDVLIVGRGGGSLEDLLPFSEERVVRAVAASRIPVISAVGHEVDVALSDLAADLRAPTPSAAAEMVSASRDDLLRRVRELESGIRRTIEQRIERIEILLRHFSRENLERNIRQTVQPYLQRYDDARSDLCTGARDRLRDARHALLLLTRTMEANSPYSILDRGYAVVSGEDGRVITRPAQTAAGERIAIRFARGSIGARVEQTDAEETEEHETEL